MDSNTDAKRATTKKKMCEGSQNQPSLQPRRRRKKDEISAEVSNKVVEGLEVVAKPIKMNTSQENKNGNFISIFKSIPTLKGGKTKEASKKSLPDDQLDHNFVKGRICINHNHKEVLLGRIYSMLDGLGKEKVANSCEEPVL